MTKQIGLVCLALGLFVIPADTSNAQFGPIQRSNRALGHWNGPGYHFCNPGPNVSYYNAWSQKNSYLISRSPQYLSRYGHETFPSPMELLQSGQSAYGQPPVVQSQGFYPSAVPMNADFVPSQRNEELDDEKIEDPEFGDDSEFGDDRFEADDDVEDRFDSEADEMNKQDSDDGFTEPRDPEAQGSPSDSDKDASVLRTPGSLFTPASHGGFNK